MLVSSASQRVITGFAALFLAVATAAGVVHLLQLRFEHGDVYPAYSTLRADPLGAKVFYQALEATPGVSVSRSYQEMQQLKLAQPVTLIFAGAPRDVRWQADELQAFDEIVSAGTRAVFAFTQSPGSIMRAPAKLKEVKPGKKDGKKDEKKDDGKKLLEEEGLSFDEVAKRWGFEFMTSFRNRSKPSKRSAVLEEEVAGLDEKLSWHSPLSFSKLDPEWTVIYTCDDLPVVIEREWGNGSIVLASDSFFLSNEALRDERHSGLLSWLVGPSTVVFDEQSHGLNEVPNIAQLLQKYRLQGAVAGLVLVALLFIWKNLAVFVPPEKTPSEADDVVGGRDSTGGLINLLRRSIPASRILETCMNEWRKTFGHDERAAAALDAALAAAPSRDPAATYRHLAGSLESAGCKFHDTKPHSTPL